MDVAPGKSCGDCSLCCKLLGVDALEKAPGQWCAHFKRGGGCGIYETRPKPCRVFHCLWMGSERLEDAWRPDRARFLMYPEEERRRLNVIVDPAQPDAWRREPYYSRLKAMSQRSLDGYSLVICIGQRRIVLFPDQEADLGVVQAEQKIVAGYATHEGQKVPFAMVLSDPTDAEAAPEMAGA
jgi:hypothetical protein